MELFVLGINHKTAPIGLREKFSVNSLNFNDFNQFLGQNESIHEHVVLSTCNRTEVYGLTSDWHQAMDHSMQTFSKFSQLNESLFRDNTYQKTGLDIIRHLFRVASGLDSMALGETEILGQVKDAYHQAFNAGWTGKVTNTLFQKSFKVGKQVRTETEIGMGHVGIASIAVHLAKKIFHGLDKKRILLIGSGMLAKQVCEALLGSGVKKLMIVNRRAERAQALAQEFGGEAIPFGQLDEMAPKVDILLSSAASPKSFVFRDRVEKWTSRRKRKSLFLIDLGVPRNIDDGVGDLSDVYLYNLDDLKLIAEESVNARKSQIQLCQKIVDEATQNFNSWFRQEVLNKVVIGNTIGARHR